MIPLRVLFRSTLLLSFLAVMLPACREAGVRVTPSATEQAHLDAHLEMIFAGGEPSDPRQWEADRVRAGHIHRIAYWAEQYKAATGHYPFAEPDSSVFRQTLIGEHVGNPSGLGDTYVPQEELQAELQAVLGPEVILPTDPAPDATDGRRAYAYGIYGRSYTTAAMLVHPVGWTEGILPGQWQYRVGATENLMLPVLQMSKLVEGGYPQNRPARPRDPAMPLR